MQKFIAIYRVPSASMEEWMKLPEEVRKADQDKMMADWGVWMNTHKDKLSGGTTAALGKTKHVEKSGVADAHNDLMLYTMIEADSHEAATEIFKDSPHLDMPGASIDVMPVNSLPGM
jgi:hypothetical protein